MSDMKDRFFRSVRANLNHLLDNVREFEEQGGLRSLFDPESGAPRDPEQWEEIGTGSDGADNNGSSHSAPSSSQDKTIEEYYANLEVPYGSDLQTVRKAYRKLMREYHPDNFADDPQKEKMATRLSQELSVAYEAIQEYLETGQH